MTISGDGSITGLVAGGLPDGSITQAEIATGVAGKGPAFSAYQSVAQTGISNTTNTKLTIDTEEFDTNNNYASSRFTPTVAGYYQINGGVTSPSITGTTSINCVIYKNGTQYKTGSTGRSTPSNYPVSNVGALVYFNGSTDYVELYVYGDMGGTFATQQNINFTYFNGALVRAA